MAHRNRLDGLPIKKGDFLWRTVSHNQMIPWIDPGPLWGYFFSAMNKQTREVEALDMSKMMVTE